MSNQKTVLITGVTGQQGGALATELAGQGFALRGMTRKPESEAARALAARGVEIVAGDLDDGASLARAMAGAWGVFAVQNTWEAGVEKEEEQGKRLAGVAREHGIAHYVYASVASAHLHTGIPHFENKARVEETVRALGFPSSVIIRPVFFMENLLGPWFLQGDKLTIAVRPDTVLQMIAVEDIGRYHARAFTHAAEMNGTAFDIAGEGLTLPQAATAMARATGRPIEFAPPPIDAVRQQSSDLALMLEWFDKTGYTADIEGNAARYGIAPTRFADWLRKKFSR